MLLARIALREAFAKLRDLNASVSLALLLSDKKNPAIGNEEYLGYIQTSLSCHCLCSISQQNSLILETTIIVSLVS